MSEKDWSMAASLVTAGGKMRKQYSLGAYLSFRVCRLLSRGSVNVGRKEVKSLSHRRYTVPPTMRRRGEGAVFRLLTRDLYRSAFQTWSAWHNGKLKRRIGEEDRARGWLKRGEEILKDDERWKLSKGMRNFNSHFEIRRFFLSPLSIENFHFRATLSSKSDPRLIRRLLGIFFRVTSRFEYVWNTFVN